MRARIAVGLAVSIVAVTLGQAQASSSCAPTGTVLAQRGGLVIWTAQIRNHHPVFACASPRGGVQKLYSDSTNPVVTHLTFAGDFAAFFLRTNVEVYSKFLFVYDRARDRVEVRDLAECDGNDECPTFPSIVRFALARDGWIAEVYEDSNVGTRPLLATNGASHHWALDAAPRIGQPLVSGNTLSWTSNLGGASSARLGSDLMIPSSPTSLTACQLLSSPEVSAAVGATATAAPGSTGSCTYNGASATLTLTARTGLSAAQQRAAENAVKAQFGFISYPNNEAFAIFTNTAGAHEQLVAFTKGAELTLDLSPGDSSADAELEHLAIVSLDRLFGVPIQRAI